MPVFLRNFLKLLKPQNMKDWLGNFPIINQFLIIFSGFMFLLLFLVVSGSFFLIAMNAKTGYGSLQLNKELRLLVQTNQKLAEIELLGGEKYSQLNNQSADKLLQSLEIELLQSRLLSGKNSKVINDSLSQLSNAFSGAVAYPQYQTIRNEVRQLRQLLIKQERLLRKSRGEIYDTTLFRVLLWVSLVLVGFGFIYWSMVAVKTATEYHYTTKYFEGISRRYAQGQLEKEIPDFPNAEFQEIKEVLQAHFQRIRERYRYLDEYAAEIPSILSDLVTTVRQNDGHCLNVKQNLKIIIDDTYHSLDLFPEIAERIKNLNLSLTETQNEFTEIHNSFQKAGVVFQNAPLEIQKIAGEVDIRDEHTKAINRSLKELRMHIDNIQQIVTVFDSIAQQTTVLSLNASIEAARAGASGSGFDIAAAEIDMLADRIGVIPQDLLKTMTKVHKRMVETIRANELILPQHKQNKKYFEGVEGELTSFWDELNRILNELREYSQLVEEFYNRQKSLEQATIFLAELNQQIPANYGRVTATLDVLGKSEELPESLEQIKALMEKLGHKLEKILN